MSITGRSDQTMAGSFIMGDNVPLHIQSRIRIVGVIWFNFHVLQLLPFTSTQIFYVLH